MPWNNFKKEHDRWLPAVIACLVLVGGALWAGSFIPEKKPEDPPAAPAEMTSPTFAPQTLRAWEGRLARFSGEGALPDEIYDVPIASLPAEIQDLLASGIVVENEEELLTWLENLTS